MCAHLIVPFTLTLSHSWDGRRVKQAQYWVYACERARKRFNHIIGVFIDKISVILFVCWDKCDLQTLAFHQSHIIWHTHNTHEHSAAGHALINSPTKSPITWLTWSYHRCISCHPTIVPSTYLVRLSTNQCAPHLIISHDIHITCSCWLLSSPASLYWPILYVPDNQRLDDYNNQQKNAIKIHRIFIPPPQIVHNWQGYHPAHQRKTRRHTRIEFITLAENR